MTDESELVTPETQRLLEAIIVGRFGWKLPLLIQLDVSGEARTTRIREVVGAVEQACLAASKIELSYADVLREMQEDWRCQRPRHQQRLVALDRPFIAAMRASVESDLNRPGFRGDSVS